MKEHGLALQKPAARRTGRAAGEHSSRWSLTGRSEAPHPRAAAVARGAAGGLSRSPRSSPGARQVVLADWGSVDARALADACVVSIASASVATLVIALGGIRSVICWPRVRAGRWRCSASRSASAGAAAAHQRHPAAVPDRLLNAARAAAQRGADRFVRRHRAAAGLRRGAVPDHRGALGLRRGRPGAGRCRRDARAPPVACSCA